LCDARLPSVLARNGMKQHSVDMTSACSHAVRPVDNNNNSIPLYSTQIYSV